MRLIAVSMIRNEADILPDFLGHCAALFDEVLVVDHSSVDGTSDMLAAAVRRMPLTVWRFAQQAYAQSRLVTALAREAFARGADWVFPIDADEFPMVTGREDLLARLPMTAAAIEWRWRNLWPGEVTTFARFDATRMHEALPPAGDSTRKIAISRRLTERRPDFVIGDGSHGVARLPEAPVPAGWLAHLPIRHPDRFVLKTRLGRAALEQAKDVPVTAGSHWRRHAQRPDGWFATPAGRARLRGLALAYPRAPEWAKGPTEHIAFAPLGRIEGLPDGVPTAEEVMAREAGLIWEPVPDSAAEAWRLERDGDRFVLV